MEKKSIGTATIKYIIHAKALRSEEEHFPVIIIRGAESRKLGAMIVVKLKVH